MNSRIEIANLKVDATLFEFINTEVLPPLKFNNLEFWRGFSDLIYKLTPQNKDLLVERKQFGRVSIPQEAFLNYFNSGER